MEEYTVSTIQDVYTLRTKKKSFKKITLNAISLISKGILRYGLKYAIFALKDNGILLIKCMPFESYRFQSKFDFWQVSNEVYKSLFNQVKTNQWLPKEGLIELIKTMDVYDYNGISFCILYSGDKAREFHQIEIAIESIIENINISNYEILICGPEDAKEEFTEKNVHYISYDLESSPRFLVGKKKNYIFDNAQYDICVLSHSRIKFTENISAIILDRPIELTVPQVNVVKDNNMYRYLDVGILSHYDITKKNTDLILMANYIDEDYLYLINNKYLFIDGGINIFNKKLVESKPYNENVAWGEAEDIDLAATCYQKGYLIDYLFELKTLSQTTKYCVDCHFKNLLKLIYKRYLKFLNGSF